MAISQSQSGSTTVTNAATQLGATITSAGQYQLLVDLNPLVVGDQFAFWAEVKNQSGSTSYVLAGSYCFVADAQVEVNLPIPQDGPANVTTEITFWGVRYGSTDRAIDWSINEITSGSSLTQADVRTAIGMASANLDTQLSTLTGYVDTEVAAIKAKTDNLPSDPADASDIASAFGTVNATLATIAGYIDTEVAAIKAKTDNLPASPSSLTQADVRTAIGMASANLDTQLSGIATDASTAGSGGLTAADVRDAVGLASANLDTQLGAIQSTASGASTFNPASDSVKVSAIGGSTAAATNLAALYGTGVTAATVDDGSAAAGSFKGSSGLSSSDDEYNGLGLVFVAGPNAGVMRRISDYTGSTKTFTFAGSTGKGDSPFPTSPSNGDAFIIIGRPG